MRNYSVDILKLIMAFMVVAQHANFLNEFSELFNYLTVNGIFRIAVPIFLIISGFYFAKVNDVRSLLVFLKRLIVMYAFWLIVYLPFWYDFQGDIVQQAKRVISVGVLGYWHLWYMSGLIMASVVLYFLRNVRISYLVTCVVVFYLSGVFIQYLGNYNYFRNESINEVLNINLVHRNFLLFCFPFMAVGFLMSRYIDILEKAKVNWFLLVVVFSFLLLLESYLNFIAIGRIGGFDNFLTLIFVSPVLFLWVRKLNFTCSFDVAIYSSGVYFLHMLFLLLIGDLISPTLLTMITFAMSCTCVYFITKFVRCYKYVL